MEHNLEIPKFHFRPFSQKSYLELNFGTCSFFECSRNVKLLKNKIRERNLEILEIRADFGSISVKNENFRGENVAKRAEMWQKHGKKVAKFRQNVANSEPNFAQ